MKKNTLIIIILVIIGFITWWITNSTNKINKEIEQSLKNQKTTQHEKAQAENLHITETQKGKKIWELTADKAFYADKNINLTKIKGKFFDENNKVIIIFESPVGNYIQEEHKLSLTNSVKAIYPEAKISIVSDKMYWNNKSTDIIAENKVKIIKEGFGTCYGDKAKFSIDFSKIALEGNTYSELNFAGVKKL